MIWLWDILGKKTFLACFAVINAILYLIDPGSDLMSIAFGFLLSLLLWIIVIQWHVYWQRRDNRWPF